MLSRVSEHAVYTPSITADYAKLGYSQRLKRSFSFVEADLDFLNPMSSLFHYPYALYSAGQAAKDNGSINHRSSVSQRDRAATTIIGDSGGFQIQQGTIPFRGDSTTGRMLGWLEGHADFSMTLDFPTGGIQSGNVAPHTKRLISEGHDLKGMAKANGLSLDYNACLKQSILNLDYFAAHRTPGATSFLNVIQGRNELESKTWYDAVKGYGLEGWAFAGTHQSSFVLILNRLIDMFRDGLLQKAKWIHFLGISTLGPAYLFTTILRIIREVNPEIGISFDTSSPFLMASKFQFCPYFRFDKTGYQIKSMSMPKVGREDDNRTLNELCRALMKPVSVQSSILMASEEVWPFPAETAVGDQIRVSDICIGSNGSSSLDVDSVWLLMNHNVHVYVRAFELLFAMYDQNRLHDHMPSQVRTAMGCIKAVFREAFAGRTQAALDLVAQCAIFLDVFAEDRG